MAVILDMVPSFSAEEVAAFLIACLMLLMDMLVGTVCAFATGTWSSKKLREGLFHKAEILLVMLLAIIGQVTVALVGHIEIFGVLIIPVCCAVILMEFGSCFESIGEANPDLKKTGIFKIFSNKNNASE